MTGPRVPPETSSAVVLTILMLSFLVSMSFLRHTVTLSFTCPVVHDPECLMLSFPHCPHQQESSSGRGTNVMAGREAAVSPSSAGESSCPYLLVPAPADRQGLPSTSKHLDSWICTWVCTTPPGRHCLFSSFSTLGRAFCRSSPLYRFCDTFQTLPWVSGEARPGVR